METLISVYLVAGLAVFALAHLPARSATDWRRVRIARELKAALKAEAKARTKGR